MQLCSISSALTNSIGSQGVQHFDYQIAECDGAAGEQVLE